MQGRSRTIAVTLLKLAVSGAILAYVLSDIQRKAPDTFRQLVDEPKHWGYLAIALGSHTMALLVGMFRWYLLTVALRFGVGLRTILRIICLAYVVEVLSDTAVPATLTENVARLMGPTGLTSVHPPGTANASGIRGIVRFTAGVHSSMFNPVNLPVTTEMQTEAVAFALTGGTQLPVANAAVVQ